MSLLAIPVASFNFDRHDHIWHIYTPDHITEQARDGNLMHVPMNAGVRLIKGQFISLGAYVYDPSQPFHTAQARQRTQMDAQEHARCTSVTERLTDRELDILRAFARGLTQQEVVKELGITTKTVDRHKTKLLDICRDVWAIDPKAHIGYHFLYKTFAPFFDSTEYTPTG